MLKNWPDFALIGVSSKIRHSLNRGIAWYQLEFLWQNFKNSRSQNKIKSRSWLALGYQHKYKWLHCNDLKFITCQRCTRHSTIYHQPWALANWKEKLTKILLSHTLPTLPSTFSQKGFKIGHFFFAFHDFILFYLAKFPIEKKATQKKSPRLFFIDFNIFPLGWILSIWD